MNDFVIFFSSFVCRVLSSRVVSLKSALMRLSVFVSGTSTINSYIGNRKYSMWCAWIVWIKRGPVPLTLSSWQWQLCICDMCACRSPFEMGILLQRTISIDLFLFFFYFIARCMHILTPMPMSYVQFRCIHGNKQPYICWTIFSALLFHSGVSFEFYNFLCMSSIRLRYFNSDKVSGKVTKWNYTLN